MTDRQGASPEGSASLDRVERLIRDQLEIMRKQLALLRSVEALDGAHEMAHAATEPAAVGAEDPGFGTGPSTSTPTGEVAIRQVPLTDVQRDVWVVCQLSPEGSAAYNLSVTLGLEGDLDLETLRRSLRVLVGRHEALRTTFEATGEHQVIHPDVDVELRVVDFSDGSEEEIAERVAAFLDSELATQYDLVTGPLFRATLLRLGTDDHTLVLSGHHLICDGWSLGLLQRDLGEIYSASIRGERPRLDDAIQFREYVAWRDEQSAASEPYWRGLYDKPAVQLDLPVDRSRPPMPSFEYGTRRAIIDKELLAAVDELALTHGVTTFMVLLAAWEILLHRLSGQDDFASGIFVSGQASMGAADLVGLCSGLLPLRVKTSGDEPIGVYLASLRDRATGAFDHQHVGAGKLASVLGVPRNASRPMLVSTVITYETQTEGIAYDGLEATESILDRRSFGAFDFEAYLTRSEADVTVDFQYATSLFEADTIGRWLRHYIHLLGEMTTRPTARLSELSLLDSEERHELLVTWNETQAPIPDEAMFEAFQRAAARSPERVAIRTSHGTTTFGELNARANRLARHLRGLGVEADRLVGVHIDRSPDMVMALLAVHKAGGAYVPLDPLFPEERLAMIASDARLHALVTLESLLGSVAVEGAVVVALDGDAETIGAHDVSDLGIPVRPEDLAYVIYTSGSTGRPKGVEVPHVALANFLESMRHRPGLDPDDALLAVTTMSFDIAGLELFLPLVAGATVVLADQREAVDAMWLRERLSAGDITVMQATPVTWQMLLDVGWAGTPGLKALCGGEALSEGMARALRPRVGSLWNLYGPTETTIWSSVSEVEEGVPVSLGQPITNTELHVLDPRLEPQPLGVPGELYIGGAGLARGYRHEDDLTSERFPTHAFEGEPARRLYRTGDVVRRFPDGRIEYLGRADFQVKIRGFRIELGEIEAVLSQHPDVKECVVMAKVGDDGAKRLVAYVVPADERPSDGSTLRTYLRQTLPDYMVPAVFVVLDAFPLTANNKVDRGRLPEPDSQRPDLSTRLVAARTETEATLALIWQEFLGLDQVGVEDNFFDLGGDSLTALRCIMEANRRGIAVPPNSIFLRQTIAELAVAAEEAAGNDEQGVVTGATPLTPAQLRFLDERRSPDPHHWNLSSLVTAEHLSSSALRTAFAGLLSHHDALRLRLWQEDGRWRQEIAPLPEEVPFQSHDLSMLPAAERSEAIERVCRELQGGFDLGEGLLLKAAHFDCGPGEPDRLFVTIHHFAVDGVSWAVFWEDLEHAYRQAVGGMKVSLPAKTTSFKAWATGLERMAQSPEVVGLEAEWLQKPWHGVVGLPTDMDAAPASNTNASAADVVVELSEDETRRLLDVGGRPEHIILTALAGCLSRWTGSSTVLIDVLSHNRDTLADGVNLSRTLGFMLSYNPLVLSHSTWDASPETLDAAITQIEHGPAGFSYELLRFLAGDAGLRDRLTALPRAELLFNYSGTVEHRSLVAQWPEAVEATGPDESPRGLRQHAIAVRAALVPNLRLVFIYSRALHHPSTIEAKAAETTAGIRRLCEQPVLTLGRPG